MTTEFYTIQTTAKAFAKIGGMEALESDKPYIARKSDDLWNTLAEMVEYSSDSFKANQIICEHVSGFDY